MYRRLSGTNYHISVQEILESEKKLKLISMLHVVSASHGKFTLTDFMTHCFETADSTKMESRDCLVESGLLAALDKCDDVVVTDAQTKSLIFIAGYVCFKLTRQSQWRL